MPLDLAMASLIWHQKTGNKRKIDKMVSITIENFYVSTLDLAIFFLTWHQKSGNMRKMAKMVFIKITNFCASKESSKKVKRQPTEWKKTFANHIFYEGLIFRKYEEPLQLNNKKTIQLKNGQQTRIDISLKKIKMTKTFNISNHYRNISQTSYRMPLGWL